MFFLFSFFLPVFSTQCTYLGFWCRQQQKAAVVNTSHHFTLDVLINANALNEKKKETDFVPNWKLTINKNSTQTSIFLKNIQFLLFFTGDAFALVYSIDSPESWEEVKTIRELILQLKGSDPSPPPIVVVGNKADLPEERRQVKLEVAECECIDWESGFVECSAKNNKNIINIFSCMLIQARLKGSLNVDSIIGKRN